jgi:protein-L-isoaspartate(D-aspartate) O-methyltransferase
MIEEDLMHRGIRDSRLLKAFEQVPRENFVSDHLKRFAYDDSPLTIGEGQTISQPYIVALMLQIAGIKHCDKVLEIGTGSGYQTALMAELAAEVYTVERIESLSKKAIKVLDESGYKNIFYSMGDGTLGWTESEIKFDKIIVSAGSPEIPKSLMYQLADGGKLVVPTGDKSTQQLLLIRKEGEKYFQSAHGGCMFVPLIGEEGWKN